MFNEGGFSCNQIDYVAQWNGKLLNSYRKLYKLGNGITDNPNCSELWLDTLDNQRERRVLMLLLAAAIENAGGL